ncbi:pantetheine-phosphate adenylyltransferase [Candidatus Fukatsuia anoeciicola]|uniref:pantetheine-phosphate adenylyltransferase n=1 Tax=Candidatus Fukatsuia anoeciicola TaxID=2994492 RepID=UPI003463FD96
MTTKAIYPGTFDPITNGHLDLLTRAATIFEKVIVVIAVSTTKQPLFALEERIRLVKNVTHTIKNVEVIDFNGLIVNFAQEKKINILIRGLRSATDFDYEYQLEKINRHLMPWLETLFLLPSEKYSFISSTLVKKIAFQGGNITSLLPDLVMQALLAKVARINKFLIKSTCISTYI